MIEKIDILLIEDNPGDARLVAEALAGAPGRSFNLEREDRLSSGLARLAAGGVDVVLLDLGLPDSQGIATLAAIRGSAPQIPVVVLSGDDDEAFAVEAVQAGAQDYLVKNHATPHVLTRSVRYAIERKRADEALRESEKLRRAIGESLDYGVWVSDPNGRNVYASESFLKLVGLTQEQCSNFGWQDVLHPDDAGWTIAAWKECVRTEGRWDVEHRFRGVDGGWHPVLARGVPVRDERGRITCWAGINLDISSLKRVEESLRQSESREHARATELQALMDAAPAAIFKAHDAECASISGNRMAYDLFRMAPGGNLSKSAPEVDRPVHFRVMKDGLEVPLNELPVQKAASKGQPVRNCEFELVFDDRPSVNLAGDVVPLFDAGGSARGAVGIFVDITQRKRAEAALRESEERLRLAMTVANEAIWEYNPVSGTVRSNETFARNFGRPPGTGFTLPWWLERIHPDDAQRIRTTWDSALREGRDSWEDEYRFLRSDGSWADVYDRAVIVRDATGETVRVVGAALDITERKRAEEALRQSNLKLQQLSRDLLRSQDYERRRISRELHDSTSQLLAALSINLSRLSDSSLEPGRRTQVLADTRELAASCSREIRTVTYLLHPPVLDEIGLASALQSYAQGFGARTGIRVEIAITPEFGRLDREHESALFRIVQEGLANVHRHSGSPSALIGLNRDSREVRLVIEDRGRGFSAELRQTDGFARFGVGVMGMRERAAQFGGRLDLVSNGAGTTLTVTLPLVCSNEENTNLVGR